MHASTLSLCIHVSSQEFFGNYILETLPSLKRNNWTWAQLQRLWTKLNILCPCVVQSRKKFFQLNTGLNSLSVVAGWPLVWKTWKCRRINSFQRNVRKVSGKNLVRENCLLANFIFSRPLWATLYCFDNFAVYKIIVNIFAEHALMFIVYW